jgi:hypothetical protein
MKLAQKQGLLEALPVGEKFSLSRMAALADAVRGQMLLAGNNGWILQSVQNLVC